MAHVSILVEVFGCATRKNSTITSTGQITVLRPGTGWKLLVCLVMAGGASCVPFCGCTILIAVRSKHKALDVRKNAY